MMNLCLLFVLCTLVANEVEAGLSTCGASPDCPLYSNQDDGMVTLEDLRQKVQSKHWVMIYYTDFSDRQTFGKCNFKWHASDTNGVIKRDLICFDIIEEKCVDISQLVTRKEDECGRGIENNATQVQMEGKFYSQNIDEYFWYENCCVYNENNKCIFRYLDLLVNKSRCPDSDKSEVDLKGLPWHHISADLKHYFNMTLSDELMNFAWAGPDCGLDGEIKTSSAGRAGLNLIIPFIILAFTDML